MAWNFDAQTDKSISTTGAIVVVVVVVGTFVVVSINSGISLDFFGGPVKVDERLVTYHIFFGYKTEITLSKITPNMHIRLYKSDFSLSK